MKTTLALIALAGALYVAPAAAQSPTQETHTRVVSHADLDLRSERGRSALDRRIQIAVSAACGTASSADPEGKNDIRRCEAETLERVAVQRDRIIAAARDSSSTVLASKR